MDWPNREQSAIVIKKTKSKIKEYKKFTSVPDKFWASLIRIHICTDPNPSIYSWMCWADIILELLLKKNLILNYENENDVSGLAVKMLFCYRTNSASFHFSPSFLPSSSFNPLALVPSYVGMCSSYCAVRTHYIYYNHIKFHIQYIWRTANCGK